MKVSFLCHFSTKEKQDVDELEAENSSTRQLFLEAGQLEEAKAKEMQEYLDAKNKEVSTESRYLDPSRMFRQRKIKQSNQYIILIGLTQSLCGYLVTNECC